MSDIHRLEDKIAKLNAENAGVTAKGREIIAPDTDGFLRVILNEIDEIVLARELILENDHGNTLGLEVVNRRLLRLNHISDESLTRLAAPVLDQAFTQESGPLVEALFKFLSEFLKDTSKLFVKSAKLEQESNPVNIGCSPEVLAQAWSINLIEEIDEFYENCIERFIDSCPESLLTCIKIDGDTVFEKIGDEVKIGQLIETANIGVSKLTKQLEKVLHPNEAQYCVVLSSSQSDGQSIIYFVIGSQKTLIMVPSDHATGIYSIWRGQIS